MNDLGLPRLDGRGEPAFAGDETAYGTVVRRATTRRRTRALASTSTTAALAFLAVAAMTTNGNGAASLAPAAPPTATASATEGPTGGGAGVLPSGFPTLRPLPLPSPFATGEPSPRPTPSGYPHDTPPSRSPGAPRGEWSVSTSYVADRPEEECERRDVGNWCLRHVAPFSVESGHGTTFLVEMCRLPARGDGRVDFEKTSELMLAVGKPGTTPAPWAGSFVGQPRGDDPHSRTVAAGSCLRWSYAWNGLDHDGRPLPRGTYSLLVVMEGETPSESPVSDAPERMWSFQVDGFEIT
ncbi:MAG TPA: hypothetical protein VGX28_14380 [Frankiaceae bacterium]|jgi:hypothetical protein|nr:hypothetical protein [Frankiaceae bacterium]